MLSSEKNTLDFLGEQTFINLEIQRPYMCILPLVLQRCKGLVAVWFLLLCPTYLHRHLLHSDDLRDAKPPQRQPSYRTQWTPQTGWATLKFFYLYIRTLHHLHCWTFCFLFVFSEKGGGQSRLLPCPDLCPLLVPFAPQQDSQEDGLPPEWQHALWASQVSFYHNNPAWILFGFSQTDHDCCRSNLLLFRIKRETTISTIAQNSISS